MDIGLDDLKTASKKVIHRATEGTGGFIGNKITGGIVKTKHVIDENPRNHYSIRKEWRNIKQIKTSIIKLEPYKISKLLSDSTVSKFVTKKWIKVNDLSSDQYSVNKNIRFKTSMLRLDLCIYGDEYIAVKGRITVKGDNADKTDLEK